MVIDRDHIVIQGPRESVQSMLCNMMESLGIGEGPTLTHVSYPNNRQAYRQGPLVDIRYNYLPMDWSKAEALMAKTFPEPVGSDLILVEIRKADPSGPDGLKPGRRLVWTDELMQVTELPV
ncbi:hypothetical protein GGR54DRAFT_594454 [Hypoxylon sp. NC1633]|nr:hypothetical protein GGR54DRAFT_594454 [Hypoxylon sp. NC1633]